VNQGPLGVLAFLGVLGGVLWAARSQPATGKGHLLAGASSGIVALACVAGVDFPLARPETLFLFWSLVAVVVLNAAKTEQFADSWR
jgi:membrane associated rhomboid family serine protease